VTRAGSPSRRLFLKLVGALPATAFLSYGCGSSGPRYLTDTERRVLGACADAIFPPDESGPGAAELGAVDFIDNLLTAFEHDPPHLHAAGPFSNRNPYPAGDGSASKRFPQDEFLEFLPLPRVHRAGWQLRLYGSRGTPGGGPNDDVIGLRDLLRDGIVAAIVAYSMSIDKVDDTFLQGIYDSFPDDARTQIQLLGRRCFRPPRASTPPSPSRRSPRTSPRRWCSRALRSVRSPRHRREEHECLIQYAGRDNLIVRTEIDIRTT